MPRFRRACVVATLGATLAGLVPGAAVVPAKAQEPETPVEPAPRPNVLLIVTDDQRKELMAAMPKTRQYFGAEGVRYPKAVVTTPMCCPSRASILTGRYAHNHGVKANAKLPPEIVSQFDTMLQAELQRANYRTALFGKFLNSWPKMEPPPFFDEYAVGKGYSSDPAAPNYWNVNGAQTELPYYSTDFIGDKAVDFIESERDTTEPWLMVLTPYAPHSPFESEPAYASTPVPAYQPNKSMLEEDRRDKPEWVRKQRRTFLGDMDAEREGQYRTLPSVDDMVTRVFSALRRTGQEDTIAFFLSDNGYLWGEHGLARKGAPYTSSIEVPFYMRWSGHPLPPGSVDRRVAANIDITPTVLDVLDLPETTATRTDTTVPPPRDGRSLLDLAVRNRIHLEHWCNGVKYQCRRWMSTRTPAYQYVEHYDEVGTLRFREYYDLAKDPWQLSNVFKDGNPYNDPDRAALKAHLAADKQCAGTAVVSDGVSPPPCP